MKEKDRLRKKKQREERKNWCQTHVSWKETEKETAQKCSIIEPDLKQNKRNVDLYPKKVKATKKVKAKKDAEETKKKEKEYKTLKKGLQ